ncbi:hypothetical protein [Alterinioella nitratireducens]|uniref:hypothetical protein n=1 Tax=Alterinioella nitratireducens TaxID=2735915 RepID=UPI000C50AD7F|nr:hypothetical protein [Alterinioella nitratireducens]MAX72086.1 hypothetical protein [Nioella sp.]NPD20341.1 hypothetical protein [Alterinioella nitratireducens]
MRQFLAPLCLALGVSPALAHNARPAIGLDLAAASYVTDLGTALPATPQCVTRVLAFGEDPAPSDPVHLDQITCLDTACTTREVVLCVAPAP